MIWRHASWFCVLAAGLLPPLAAHASDRALVEIRHGMTNARFVEVYSPAQRADALQRVFLLGSPPVLGASVALTPNAPFAPDGSHLSFWKPSFVIGTEAGGEAGINFWSIHQEGHMNVGLTPTGPVALDCRLLSAGKIVYKIYAGAALRAQAEAALHDGHFLLMFSPSHPGEAISVELWPSPGTEPVRIFGCDVGAVDRRYGGEHP
jgi:hypothetical protein